MRGRPRKSIDDLKLYGGFRDDRHGARAKSEPDVGGLPKKPKGLSRDASWLWDLVVKEYGDAGPVRAIDTAALEQACILYGLLKKAQKAAEKDPIDKNIRCAVTSYYAAWDRAAAKLGITPRDRRSIDTGGNKKESGVKRRNRA